MSSPRSSRASRFSWSAAARSPMRSAAATAFAGRTEASGAFTSVTLELDADLGSAPRSIWRIARFCCRREIEQALAAGATRAARRDARCAPPTRPPASCSRSASPKIRSDSPTTSCAPPRRSRATRVSKVRCLPWSATDARFVLVLTENAGHPFATATQERVIPAIARARVAARRARLRRSKSSARAPSSTPSAAAERAEHEVDDIRHHRIHRRGVAAAAGVRLDAAAAARRLDAGVRHHRRVHRRAPGVRQGPRARAGVRLEPDRQRHRLLHPFLRGSLSRSCALDSGVGRAARGARDPARPHDYADRLSGARRGAVSRASSRSPCSA